MQIGRYSIARFGMCIGVLFCMIATLSVVPAHARVVVPRFSLHVFHSAAFAEHIREFVNVRIAQANQIFAPTRVAFREGVFSEVALGALETRADRHQLGRYWEPNSICVFVVPSLRDVDDTSRMRQGVHWRPRRIPHAHFLIVTEDSHETTLAHELGHYFGNPHSATPNNIMSYLREGTQLPFFDGEQIRVIQRSARRFAMHETNR